MATAPGRGSRYIQAMARQDAPRRRGRMAGWLALAAAALGVSAPAAAQIVINEIHYNSPNSPDVEFIELYNAGAVAQSLNGWSVVDDDDSHQRCMLEGTLAPGEFLVVPGRTDLFTATYPDVENLNPNEFDSAVPGMGFALGNDADTVRLFAPGNVLADVVAYTDSAPWPETPDGTGPSLELINPAADNASPANWAAGFVGGTPGETNSAFVPDLPPTVEELARDLPLPDPGQTVHVTARAGDDGSLAAIELWVDDGAGFMPQPMADDGTQGDGAPGDSVFGASIAPRPAGTVVRYYVTATDDSAQTTAAPDGAPADWQAFTVGYRPPELRVNEIVASNQTTLFDEAGDADDWLELRNPGPDTVNVGGMFLSRDFADTRMWPLPPVVLAAGDRLVVWCDEEPGEGALHAGFRLSASGGEMALFDSVAGGNTLLHGFTHGPQNGDRALGFHPEDSDRPELLASATPDLPNTAAARQSDVCINELLAASAVGVPDFIELANRGAAAVDLGGWGLTDDPAFPMRFVVPPGTILDPGEHVVFDQNELGFGIAADGSEALLLSAADGTTAMDWIDPPPQLSDVSYGRFPDGSPDWHFFGSESPELPNTCAQGPPPLPPVTGLLFESRSAVAWDALAGASRYDLVRGDLGLVLATQSFAGSAATCLQNNGRDTRGWVPGTPGSGEIWYVVVRGATDTCRFGSYDAPPPQPLGSRDPALAAVCP